VDRTDNPVVRVGIIGVGNCARAIVEGTAYYRARESGTQFTGQERIAGLMHVMVGPYGPGSVEPVVAWDVDTEKVGKDLWTAIRSGQNLDVGIDLPRDGDWEEVAAQVIVQRAPTLDGAGEKYLEKITLADDWPNIDGAEIIEQIRGARVDVLLNYLPVGSQAATEWWADIAVRAEVGFVNNIPVFIARRPAWRERFRAAGLPLIGDDIKSQLGATYLHRLLVAAFSDRGITLDRTYQLNVGGNMDFYNMLESTRLASKRESKTGAVTDAYRGHLAPRNVHIGPSDHVQWLGDTKVAFIRCEGRGFAGAPIEIDMNIKVPDSPNSAGVVIDAARIAKLAMDRGDVGVDQYVSAWLFKAPPPEVAQTSDLHAMEALNAWIAEAHGE
jgi:myo-inositol-1-phosphate synthase